MSTFFKPRARFFRMNHCYLAPLPSEPHAGASSRSKRVEQAQKAQYAAETQATLPGSPSGAEYRE